MRWFSGVSVISANSCVWRQCSGWWELQSRVICNSLCGVNVNVMEEWPLVAIGRKATDRIRDRAPPKERLPDDPMRSRREVEWRWNRGRDGGPGPCANGETGDWGRAGSQGRDDGTEAHQGGVDGTGAHQGGADGAVAHQGGADGTGAHQGGAGNHQTGVEDHHGGAEDHQTRAEDHRTWAVDHQTEAEDHRREADWAGNHGRVWDLGVTETDNAGRAETDNTGRAFMVSGAVAGNTESSSVVSRAESSYTLLETWQSHDSVSDSLRETGLVGSSWTNSWVDQVQVQVELYCHSAACGDIQWEMSCLTGPRCYINTDIQQWSKTL